MTVVRDGSNRVFAAAVMVLVRPDGSVLLGHRVKDGLWGLPGGKVDAGLGPPPEDGPQACDRDAEETALRECWEETGIVAKDAPGGVHLLGTVVNRFRDPDSDGSGDYAYLTVAYGAASFPNVEAVNREPEKCYEWKWFRVEEFPGLLLASTASLLPLIARFRDRCYPHGW